MIRLSLNLVALSILVLSGCESMPERRVQIETVEVKVPVRVPCIDKRPEAPVYQYGSGPYPGDAAAVGLLVADLEASKTYGHQWEAAAAGCVKTPESLTGLPPGEKSGEKSGG